MTTGYLSDKNSRNITGCCVTALYNAMYHVHFYAATDKINVMSYIKLGSS